MAEGAVLLEPAAVARCSWPNACSEIQPSVMETTALMVTTVLFMRLSY